MQKKYVKNGKGLLLFVEERATVDDGYYLKMLKKHFYVIRRLSCGQKFTILQYGDLLPGSKCFLIIISMKMFLIISKRRADFLILVTSIYLIMQFGTWWERYSTRTYSSMKTFKGFQKQYQMHGIDRKKKSSIIQSNNGGCN